MTKRLSPLLAACALLAIVAPWGEKGVGMERKPAPEGSGTVVSLPAPRHDGTVSVEQAILRRRSVREYRSVPLTLGEVGQLLWAAQGITSPRGLRAAPSAGALYPLSVYVVAGNVTGLAPGVYRYEPQRHALVMTGAGDRREQLCRAALLQSAVRHAPATLVLAAVFERTTGKYGRRGIRYVHMDEGHAGENIYLQAVPLGLGTVVVGAFDDGEVQRVLSLPREEEPLSLMPVGKR